MTELVDDVCSAPASMLEGLELAGKTNELEYDDMYNSGRANLTWVLVRFLPLCLSAPVDGDTNDSTAVEGPGTGIYGSGGC